MTPAEFHPASPDRARDAVGLFFARLARSMPGSTAAILFVALCCYLPGFTASPPVDRDESSIADAARQMVESGDLADIRLLNHDGRHQPPGMVWLEAAAVILSGQGSAASIVVYRLPSLIAAIAAALLTWWMGLAFGRPRAALLAGLFAAASLGLAEEARLAGTHAVALALLVLAQGALARLWLHPTAVYSSRAQAALFWLSAGMGVLVGGLVVPLVLLGTVAILSLADLDAGWLWRLEPVWGLPLALIVAALWPLAVLAGHVPPDLAALDLLERLGGSFHSHAPPGTYILTLFEIFFPAASFLVLGVPWLLRSVLRPAVLFGLASSVPLWIVAEFWADKLPEYVLPAFPALALLAATAVDAGRVPVTGRVTLLLSLGPLVLPLGALIVVPLALVLIDNRLPTGALPAFAIGAIVGAIAWRWLRQGAATAAAAAAVIAAIFVHLGLFGLVAPALDRVHLSPQILAAAPAAGGCADPMLAAAGYVEPSLDFLTGGRVAFLDAARTANFLSRRGCRVALVERRQISSFLQRAEDIGLDVTDRGGISGYDLGAGRWVTVRLYIAGSGS